MASFRSATCSAICARAGRTGHPFRRDCDLAGPLRHHRPPASPRGYLPGGRERAGHQDSLKAGISTRFYSGADPAQARTTYPYYHEYLRPKRPGGRGFLVDRAAFETGTSGHGAIMIGSAAEITDKLLDAHKTLRLDRIFAQVDWGGLPASLVEESIARYATEIVPPCARPERRAPRFVRKKKKRTGSRG